MSTMEFVCASKGKEDAALVWRWRQDKDALRWSFHKTAVSLEQFVETYQRDYFCFPELPPVFVLYEGKKAAFIRLKPCRDPFNSFTKTADVSIVVAEEFRGKGIGAKALSLFREFAKERGIGRLFAYIKEGNEASLKAFLKAGFQQIESEVKELFATGEKVPVWRLILDTDSKIQRPSHVTMIAEAGSNWVIGEDPEKNRREAFKLIEAASQAGADAIKFQVFQSSLYVANAGVADYLGGTSINDLFDKLEMPASLVLELASFAKEKQIAFMASCFSPRDFELVDPYVSSHKIASYEIGYTPLLELVAASQKPVYVSTGAATEEEIAWTMQFLRQRTSAPLTLMQCTAAYPAPNSDLNLSALCFLRKRFGCPVGLSDHSKDPFTAAIGAVCLGAVAIEKHFTMSRQAAGPDHPFAIEPKELEELVKKLEIARLARGEPYKFVTSSEEELRHFACRGIQALKLIKKGEILEEGANIAILRPGKQQKGVHAKYMGQLEGKPVTRDLEPGEGVQFGDW